MNDPRCNRHTGKPTFKITFVDTIFFVNEKSEI